MWSRISELFRSRVFLWVLAAVIVVVAGVAIFIAANADPEVVETTTSTSTTTTVASTTTTAVATTTTSGTTSQINGLAVADPTLLNRRLLAVKIDNHPNARPHSGIQQADAVIELMVEGVTRFISLWQQSDSEFLGPMRSGRPTDQTLLSFFNEPSLAISGAQSWVQDMIRSVGIHLIGEVEPATFRVSGRRAPHNLFANTLLLREYADSVGYPNLPIDGPMWEFGPMRADARAANRVAIDFLSNPVEWTWDPTTATWLRTVGGNVSGWRTEDDVEGQIGFPVLVALFVEQYSVGNLPASRTSGTGLAYVFAEGKVIEGTWQREGLTDWFRLTDMNGATIQVPPGQAWISLVPDSGGLVIE
ncbi:MAG: DUF3048 domain-containing protein [Actinomycetota bacterium]|nr:DUF3048 domain-containing protein [Actinomycetota bacterium]